MSCLNCNRPTTSDNLCETCRQASPYKRAWFVGYRQGELESLLDGYKFERQKAASGVVAELLLTRLPIFPPRLVVVPVPTLSQHVRQRGYDHTLLIAKRLASQRHLKLVEALRRASKSSQLGQRRAERLRQAKTAFVIKRRLAGNPACLLVDDIFTTGATVRSAAEQLLRAGAKEVWLAIVAKQPSTKGGIKGKM